MQRRRVWILYLIGLARLGWQKIHCGYAAAKATLARFGWPKYSVIFWLPARRFSGTLIAVEIGRHGRIRSYPKVV